MRFGKFTRRGRRMLARGEFCGGHMQICMLIMPFNESRCVNLDKDNRFAFPIFNPGRLHNKLIAGF